MDRKVSPPGDKPSASKGREDRLKAALKANISRRKAQARLRQEGAAEDRAEDKNKA